MTKQEREAKRLAPDGCEYVGTFDSVAEFAKRSSIDCGDYPDNMPAYIDDNVDWDAVGERLLVQDYTYQTGKTGTHYYLVN